MRRAYVFGLRPTARQHTGLAACVEAHRELYGAVLRERRDAWSHSKTRVYYGDQSAQLTEIRSARPDLLAPTAAAAPEGDADDAITAAWKAAGGEDSVLGAKQGDVYAVGNGFAQNFAGGKVFFTPATGARAMYGAVSR
jgi:LGFP repeat/Helix-turn-helix domain